MELTSLLERMKMGHLPAQLDGVCEHAAKADHATPGGSPWPPLGGSGWLTPAWLRMGGPGWLIFPDPGGSL